MINFITIMSLICYSHDFIYKLVFLLAFLLVYFYLSFVYSVYCRPTLLIHNVDIKYWFAEVPAGNETGLLAMGLKILM